MALVTGATSGIGAAFAEALPRETGLLLTGRQGERLQEAARRFAAPGRRIESEAADLATPAGREALLERARQCPIDLLVCNAGLGHAGRFDAHDIGDERAIIAVNILAVVELMHGLLPGMLAEARRERRRAGAIIVSSAAAFGPSPGMASYAASKAFALRLAEALAVELHGEPIDLLALCPDYTATEFFARAGLPPPARAMTAAAVAQEGLAALGRRTVHICGARDQRIARLVAQNPALAVWRWPRKLARRMRRGPAGGPALDASQSSR